MAVSDTGELVYYVGCVVVLYNHIRRTQRHYLEHTGAITWFVAAIHLDQHKISCSTVHTKLQPIFKLLVLFVSFFKYIFSWSNIYGVMGGND